MKIQSELAHNQQTVDDVEGDDEEQHGLAVQDFLTPHPYPAKQTYNA